MKNRRQNPPNHIPAVFMALWLITIPGVSQTPDPIGAEQIAVMARPSADSITLRWAPLNYKVWRQAILSGYRIERFVLARNGKLVSQTEKAILHAQVTALPETQWEPLVMQNKYAAIAAQAIYGDRFEVDLKEGDIFTIVNKVQENEQRFAFALFSADMSPDVAVASGLWFTDKQVKSGEQYLYRIVVNSADSLRGSVFVSPDDPYHLPKPRNLKGEFKDQIVSLKWDKNVSSHYTAYIVERSFDGKVFKSTSESPLVTVSPTASEDTRYEYAMDSLNDLSTVYHYRVKGLTPFGEESPASEVVSGKGLPAVNQVPYISSAENKQNTSILLQWDFPEVNSNAITGFSVERSAQPEENFLPVTKKLLSSDVRNFEDRLPGLVNYYRVTAHGLDGALYPSPLYFAQLVDSIPPSAPLGLKAKIDHAGKVILSWESSTESDIFGYRIYKAFHESEELAQLTSEPIRVNTFTETLDLNTLNESVIYSVMAIDISQNHSPLSALLNVALPDKVPPQAPVFLPVSSDAAGVILRWMPGSSEDIVSYKLFRKLHDTSQWEQLAILESTNDTLYSYSDKSATAGQRSIYTIVSVDDAGLESDPAKAVAGIRLDNTFRPAITWKKPRINHEEREITLMWSYKQSQVQSYKLFRTVDGQPLVLFKTLAGDTEEFTDHLIPGRLYKYRIMAHFRDGKRSSVSDEIVYQY